MIDASPVHGDFIFDTGGGIERSKPRKRVANVQNKPKIMKKVPDGAWLRIACTWDAHGALLARPVRNQAPFGPI